MKTNVLTKIAATLLLTLTAIGCAEVKQSNDAENDTASVAVAMKTESALPTLHKIEEYTFQAPYSCNGSFEKSALFLSQYSKTRNAPELLFNGACGSPLYVEASTAGDDFSLISDLGPVDLESISASKAFNYQRAAGLDNIFTQTAQVIEGHTYTVLIAKGEVRALYAFRVESMSPTGEMKIKYAVKSYSIQTTKTESSGFDWQKENN